jgi:hypothetical protein
MANVARMEKGNKSPFEIGDYVTAISKNGATTKARGRITAILEPLDAAIFGDDAAIWEYDVAWEDRRDNVLVCEKCSRREVVAPVLGLALGRAIPNERGECCGQPMSYASARDARVSEHEIKKLSAIDLIAELNRGDNGPLPDL